MFGRPWVYGLAAGGRRGVERVLDIFISEIDATLALLGCPSIRDLDRSYLEAA
jgi:isopentenyl diphosphate isomerase/L-lactate dehydrogenase-like FMN-dependent dehydrogenase